MWTSTPWRVFAGVTGGVGGGLLAGFAAGSARRAAAAMKDHTVHFSKFAASATPMRDPALLSKLAELEAKSPAPAELPANLKEKAYGAYNSWSWTQMYVAKYSGQVCK